MCTMPLETDARKRVLVIGGWTGTYTALLGLKDYRSSVSLSAVVTMADSGGSTGRLRDEFGILPVGDIRLALLALARRDTESEDILRKLFLYRFNRGEGLSGHTFGNLLLVALADILGTEERAIEAAARLLDVTGEVIPVTTDKVDLIAHYTDGRTVQGEHQIDIGEGSLASATIAMIALSAEARAHPRAVAAIEKADLIVLGPGDLYTSILANCVVSGIPEALQRTGAQIVFVSNLMSRRAQTNGMGTHEHLQEITRYIGREPDYLLVNTTPFRKDLLELYENEDEYPVSNNYSGTSVKVIEGNFLASEDVVLAQGDVLRRSLIRHDSYKLARGIMAVL